MTQRYFHVIQKNIRKNMRKIHALIPPLSSLQALDSLSRTGSITRTAGELSLTQSAISHKLKALEAQLGFPILHRDGRGVRLSHRARAYASEIAPALEILGRASDSDQVAGSLNLNVAPGFAAFWLTSRLSGFTRQHPDLKISLNTAPSYGDLGRREDDLYISFATKQQVPQGSTHLMDVFFFVVAAPSLTGGYLLKTLTDITNHPILHLVDRKDWTNWIANLNTAMPHLPSGMMFQDLHTYLAAARAGLGIALGDTLTCEDSLKRGELIKLHPKETALSRAYWLVPGTGTPSKASDAFKTWLRQEIATDS